MQTEESNGKFDSSAENFYTALMRRSVSLQTGAHLFLHWHERSIGNFA